MLVKGPFAYENWMHFVENGPTAYTVEVPLYTDARITGQETGEGLNLGPYALLNTVPYEDAFGWLRPNVILRANIKHEDAPAPHSMETDETRYHGGGLFDELGALLSLCLGVRFWPGGVTRDFGSDADPKGRPRAEPNHVKPTLIVRKLRPIVPRLRTAPLRHAQPLERLPHSQPQDAIALVRASRLYQQALWLADAQPHLTWLLLVSAVETVAVHYFEGGLDAVSLLKKYKAEVAESISASCSNGVLQLVAEHLAPTMKATAKYDRFLKDFLPEPPTPRPPEVVQCSWEPASIRKALLTIYEYRSRALHAGTPFPEPMCSLPLRFKDWEAVSEKPGGTATSFLGGTWTHEDVPMHLHVFEHIARGAILNWWNGCDTHLA